MKYKNQTLAKNSKAYELFKMGAFKALDKHLAKLEKMALALEIGDKETYRKLYLE